MLQHRDIPLGENSQGDKNLIFMSYLKKSQYQSQLIWSQKMSRSQKKLSQKSLSLGLDKFENLQSPTMSLICPHHVYQ